MKYPLIATLLLSTTVSATEFICEAEKTVLMQQQSKKVDQTHDPENYFLANFDDHEMTYSGRYGHEQTYDCVRVAQTTTCTPRTVGALSPAALAFMSYDDRIQAETFQHDALRSWFVWYTCREI